MDTVRVPLPDGDYDIHIDPGGLGRVGSALATHCRSTLATIISDETVAPLYAERLGRSLIDAGIEYTLMTIPPGEPSKSLDMASQLYDELAAARHARNAPIIALGGGVVGDLAGFVAATWHRGVPFVQCPTTLEAMIDAAVGGKTAVNHRLGKNLIGAFHQPLFVMVDPDTLVTLANRDYTAALAESVKHAVISGEAFLAWHEQHASDLRQHDLSYVPELIRRNCEIKAAIVAADEREQSESSVGRAALNFGHTIGHAIESSAEYKLRHGEAVALGMVGEMELAVRCMGFLNSDRLRIERLMDALGLPLTSGIKEISLVYENLFVDKKAMSDRLRFVVPRGPGDMAWLDSAAKDDILHSIQWIVNRP
ncbi:MAG: 3-dehydroquinate synthase [Planctomycetota bacterium]